VVSKKAVASLLTASVFISAGAFAGAVNAQSLDVNNVRVNSPLKTVQSHLPVETEKVNSPVKTGKIHDAKALVNQAKSTANSKIAKIKDRKNQVPAQVPVQTEQAPSWFSLIKAKLLSLFTGQQEQLTDKAQSVPSLVKQTISAAKEKAQTLVNQGKDGAENKAALVEQTKKSANAKAAHAQTTVNQTKDRVLDKKSQAQSLVSHTQNVVSEKVSPQPYDNKVKTLVLDKKAHATSLVENAADPILPYHTVDE
jgi:F0F1-type ATP synthase membrane subunit b/b'